MECVKRFIVCWKVSEGCWECVHGLCLCLQEKLKQVFDNLIQLDHANLVKFHKYWTDTKGDKRRVSGQWTQLPGNVHLTFRGTCWRHLSDDTFNVC